MAANSRAYELPYDSNAENAGVRCGALRRLRRLRLFPGVRHRAWRNAAHCVAAGSSLCARMSGVSGGNATASWTAVFWQHAPMAETGLRARTTNTMRLVRVVRRSFCKESAFRNSCVIFMRRHIAGGANLPQFKRFCGASLPRAIGSNFASNCR